MLARVLRNGCADLTWIGLAPYRRGTSELIDLVTWSSHALGSRSALGRKARSDVQGKCETGETPGHASQVEVNRR